MSAPAGKSIASLLLGIDANVGRAKALALGLSDRDFNWRPQPNRWSIAQNVSHLNVVNGRDLAALEQAIGAGKSRNARFSGPFRYGPLTRKFVASMEPPAAHKWKVPPAYRPPDDAPLAHTIQEYRKISAEVRRLASAASGLDLAGVKTALPALPAFLKWFLRMPLGARFELINAHDRRHLWQAEQVRAELRNMRPIA